MEMPFKRRFLYTAIATCLSVGLMSSQVWAQDAAEDEEDEATQTTETTDRVTVTGSLLRRDEFTSASPITVVTAEDAFSLGQVDAAEFLQSTSVAQSGTNFNNQFGGFVIEGGLGIQSLSLRGLGAQRTLVLLNGRRPGPAGTRGEVGAFDLNVLPASIIQRAEILKDGASSIYGSDAVAGVVNVITRRSIDRPELNFRATVPFESGGESYDISGAYGWNFNRGSIVFAGEYQLREALKRGDRDFLRCDDDVYFDLNGRPVSREDRSIWRGTAVEGCANVGVIGTIDDNGGSFGLPFGFVRFIPSPTGRTIGPFAGFEPDFPENFNQGDPNVAFWTLPRYNPLWDNQDVFAELETLSLYSSADFSVDLFGGAQWSSEILFTRRNSTSERMRQFFPTVADSRYGFYDFPVPTPSGIARPIMPFPFNSSAKIDYYYASTSLEGDLPFGNWGWQANASYSYSDATYKGDVINLAVTGDIGQGSFTAPPVNYLDPGFLDGSRIDELFAAVGAVDRGTTVYDQLVFSAIATGNLFNLPAGSVGLAVGAEYRYFSLDDQPGEFSQSGTSWGLSSAGRTKGSDNVAELFGEIELPLLAGLPFAESLVLNASGRVFDYDSAGSDHVWKAGLNWQITPSFRVRSTRGTSYRAPALYELFLEDQTAFFSQLNDPCIEWGESANENIRRNCAAVGIPSDFQGGGSSGTVVTGGGAGRLEAETATQTTAGFVFTPTFLNISIAVDYFDIEVNDQITTLGAGSILAGCYGGRNFPNAFCDAIDRNPAGSGAPQGDFGIAEVRSGYINVNQQVNKGVDLTVRYDNDFSFGRLIMEANTTWTTQDIQRLFDPNEIEGFDENDQNGTITRPKLVGNGRISLRRDDWEYTWGMRYVRRTSDGVFFDEQGSFLGKPVIRVIDAERRHYHSFSVTYRSSNWSVLAGVDNIFNTAPPNITGVGRARNGTVPAFATQYPLRGRTGFVRLSYLF